MLRLYRMEAREKPRWWKPSCTRLDTPGFLDFIGEVISALRVADGAVVLIDSVSGVEVGTEITWQYLDRYKLPRFAVINKMERDNANFQKAVASLQEFSSIRLIPIQLPWGEKQEFKGVIDLLSMKAYKGNSKSPEDIPAEYRDAAESARMALVEAAAEGEDALLEKYLDSGELSDEEIIHGLQAVTRSCTYVPVLVASGANEIGAFPLLDAITNLLPSPAEVGPALAEGKTGEEQLQPTDRGPLAAYVWKTTADPFVGKLTFFRVYPHGRPRHCSQAGRDNNREYAKRSQPPVDPAHTRIPWGTIPGGHPAENTNRLGKNFPHPDPPDRRGSDPFLAHGTLHKPDDTSRNG
jgi:translation elongation factor EF-G